MKTYNRKNCSNYMPLDNDNRYSAQPSCSHCAYYSTKNCHKETLDALDYPDDDYNC